MLEGWANPNVKKESIPRLPGSKAIFFKQDGFTVLDCYFKNGIQSMGDTIIWHKKEPVWKMSYGGSYSPEVIPFLKEALLKAYRERSFVGGRGPSFFEGEGYVYVNQMLRNDFTSFLGEERVYSRQEAGKVVGHHAYWGRILDQHGVSY
ncbi:MAG: DUF5680 domain-containing protein [Patescibacteria group bacterium]